MAELATRGDLYPDAGALSFDHHVNGTVEISGDHPQDQWSITVDDNTVTHTRPAPTDIDWDFWG
jgi:hypothetical protein